MADLADYPKQSFFSETLQSPIDASQTTGIILTDVPEYSTGGETVNFDILDPDSPETVSATGWNSSTNALTGVTRGVDTYTGESASGSAHGAGIAVVLSNPWNLYDDIATAVNTKADSAGDTFTGPVDFTGASTTFRVPNLTTAERDALGAPANGMVIYNTTAGEIQFRDGGAWLTMGSSSTPNASETVAGSVELATAAEMAAGTSSGGTGARLVPPNDAIVKTSSGAGDENKLAVLNASGEFADGFMGAAETGASVVVKSKSDSLIDDSLLALTTAGDIIQSDGTDITRLAIGTASQVLAVNSGATAVEYVTAINTYGSGIATRSWTAASGTQSIAHGLGATPARIRITIRAEGTSGNEVAGSDGVFDGTTTSSNSFFGDVDGTTSDASSSSSNIAFLGITGGNNQSATAAVDGTNIDLVWTLSTGFTGTMHIMWEAHLVV